MSAPAMKNWFLHLNGQPEGPFTHDQVIGMFREGAMSKETHAWCEGMPSWAVAKDIPELRPIFSGKISRTIPPPPARPSAKSEPSYRPASMPPHNELSHLMELNAKDVDDRTSALDPNKLRSARKEAAVALKVADKAERKSTAIANSVRGTRSSSGRGLKFVFLGIPVVALACLGAAIGFKLVSFDELRNRAGKLFSSLTSTLPLFDDVSADQYERLRLAVQSDINTAGPVASIALSTEALDKPVFYVASNLPEGAHLSFRIQGDPTTVVSDKPIEIRFPVTLSKHFARSKSVHTMDGSPVPPGEYTVAVTADEEQSSEVKKILSKHPLTVTQRYFLGGVKDSAYLGKLAQVQLAQREKTGYELRQASLLVARLEFQLHLANEALQKVGKLRTPTEQKNFWADFSSKWAVNATEPVDKGRVFADIFAALHEVWATEKSLYDLQSTAIANAQTAQLGMQISALLAQTEQKLTQIKTRIDAASHSAAPH